MTEGKGIKFPGCLTCHQVHKLQELQIEKGDLYQRQQGGKESTVQGVGRPVSSLSRHLLIT